MNAIFSAFGIDWRLLLIDCVNFGLLLLALWYFLYAPLMKIIEERRIKVAQGVYDAAAAAEHLRQVEASRSELLADAGREADDVLAKARVAALAKQAEMVAAADAAAARTIEEAAARARDMQETALQESKKEVAKLVVLGIERAMVEK